MPEYLHLRPHHLLCLLSFSGKGYSPQFTEKMKGIQQAYFSGETRIRIAVGVDDVCEFCPELVEDCCGRLVGIPDQELDHRVCRTLKIEPGEYLAEVLWRTIQRGYDEDLGYRLCEGCSWLEEGDCPAKIVQRLRELLNTTPDTADGAKR